MYSKRIEQISPSPTRRLMPYANEAVKNGKNIFYLNIGQPDIATPKEYFDAVRNFDKKTLGYSVSQRNPRTNYSNKRVLQKAKLGIY